MRAIQDDYPDEFAWCYGCGRLNEDGYHLRTGWFGEKTITIYTPRPEHTGGIPGFVYGGLLASFIDCHGAGSASLYLHRKNGNEIGEGVNLPRFVTKSLKILVPGTQTINQDQDIHILEHFDSNTRCYLKTIIAPCTALTYDMVHHYVSN